MRLQTTQPCITGAVLAHTVSGNLSKAQISSSKITETLSAHRATEMLPFPAPTGDVVDCVIQLSEKRAARRPVADEQRYTV